MKRTITKEFKWESAHVLENNELNSEENKKIFGKCHNVHGHSYKLFVTISSIDNKLINGMVMNFTQLKSIVNEHIVERFDHKFLNDDVLFETNETTCENQIVVIWNLLEPILSFNGVVLEKLRLYETETSYATLTNEDI